MKKIFISLLAIIQIICIISEIKAQDYSIDKVFCLREITREGNNIKVSLLINTINLDKDITFKLRERFPEGFSAKVTKPYGSENNISGNSINFEWAGLPEANLFMISYELNTSTPISEAVSISGNLSYVTESGIKYVSVKQADFSKNSEIMTHVYKIPPYKSAGYVSKPAPPTARQEVVEVREQPRPILRTTDQAIEKPVEEPIKVELTTEAPVKEKPRLTSVEPAKTEEKPEPAPKPIVSEPKPVIKTEPKIEETSNTQRVFYAVQIGASSSKLAPGFYDKHNFDKTVEEIFFEGMYRYSLGRFPTLREANSYMAKVKQKNVQCFVVAYIDGKRVPVKEALEITKR